MDLLCNYHEIQSWVEFLSAIIYFLFACYLLFIGFLKYNMITKEKKKLYIISFGYLAISVVFAVRQMTHHCGPDSFFNECDLSTAILIMLLGLPGIHYCSSCMGLCKPLHFSYIVALLAMVSVAIFIPFAMDMTVLSIIISVFYLNIVYISFMFLSKIRKIREEGNTSLRLFKNDIFIFATIIIFSVVISSLMILDFKYLYVKMLLSISMVVNTLLFIKIALPFSSKAFAEAVSRYDGYEGLNDENNRIVKYMPDNLKVDELYCRLIKYFENDKPYLKPDLKIGEVSLFLYTNKTYLSRVINDKHNQNFNQFVNSYRIEEVKRIFNDNNNLSIQELCSMSGFGSMATFSIAFRFHIGNTPADWCKEQKLKAHSA